MRASATIGTLQLGRRWMASALLANGTGGIGVAPCFVAGTRISTERGEVAVEDLRVGDRVQVVAQRPLPGPAPRSGEGWGGGRPSPSPGSATAPSIARATPTHTRSGPVRVAAHAFGPNRPCRDLYLSPDHALFVVDVLIPVKHLINGTTITQVPRDEVTYYHVELPEHAVLLADNLPAESVPRHRRPRELRQRRRPHRAASGLRFARVGSRGLRTAGRHRHHTRGGPALGQCAGRQHKSRLRLTRTRARATSRALPLRPRLSRDTILPRWRNW